MHRRHRRAATRRPLANHWAEPETADVLGYHVSAIRRLKSGDLHCLALLGAWCCERSRDEMRLLLAE
jgi:hypothetical protein